MLFGKQDDNNLFYYDNPLTYLFHKLAVNLSILAIAGVLAFFYWIFETISEVFQ